LRSPGALIARSTPMVTPLAAVLVTVAAGPAFDLPKAAQPPRDERQSR